MSQELRLRLRQRERLTHVLLDEDYRRALRSRAAAERRKARRLKVALFCLAVAALLGVWAFEGYSLVVLH